MLLPEFLLGLFPLGLPLSNPLHQFLLLLLISQQVTMHQDLPLDILLLLHACQLHPIFPEAVLSALLDISNALHGLDGLHVEIPVVLDGLVPLLLELEDGVLGDLFVVELAGSLGPGQLAGVVFCLEVAVALGTAETEVLAVVAHEHDSMARVDWPGTEVAPLDPHQQSINIMEFNRRRIRLVGTVDGV
jgi:hypothetical protein